MADMTDQKQEPATLQVSGEDVKLNMPEGVPKGSIDLIDRDPNNMNEDIKVKFEEIIGEPDRDIYSFDKVWIISFKVFTTTKLWCYRITSLILAIPLSACWGIYFACLAFCRIWVCVPCLRSVDIELLCFRRLYTICLQTFLAPCYDAIGRVFSHIRVSVAKGEE